MHSCFLKNVKKPQSLNEETSMKAIDAILKDNSEELSSIINDSEVINNSIDIKSYQMPEILKGRPPLISVAAFFGAVNCVSCLLDIGADQNIPDSLGRMPAHFAAAGGKLEIVRTMLNSDPQDEKQYLPIHYAAQMGKLDVVKYLWSKNRSLSAAGEMGKQPIHFACENGHTAIVEFLYTQDCSIDDTDDDLHTPLMYACIGGHLDTVQFLLGNYAKLNNSSVEGRTAITFAAQNGYLSIVKTLIEHGVKYKYQKRKFNALVEAAAGGHLDVVKYLIQKGVEPNIKTSDDVTPFWAAVFKNRLPVVKYLLTDESMYQLPKPKDVKFSPGLYACRNNYVDLVKFFVKKKLFDPHEVTGNDAKEMIEKGYCEIIQYLSSIGFDIFSLDYGIRSTPLDGPLAISNKSDNLQMMLTIAKISDAIGNTHYGQTIEYASFLQDKAIMKFILSETNCDFSKIHCNGELPTKKPADSKEAKWFMLKFMMDNGGTEPCENGQSPAGLFAIKMNDLKMISVAIERGAKCIPSVLAENGIIILAIVKQQETLLDTLLSMGVDLNLNPSPKHQVGNMTPNRRLCPYPVSVCLRALVKHFAFDNGQCPLSSDEKEKNFLMNTFKKLLSHGALLVSDDFNHLTFVVGCKSKEIFELVFQHALLTAQVIEKHSLLYRSIEQQSKRYFNWFVSYGLILFYDTNIAKQNAVDCIFLRINENLPQELAYYFLGEILNRVTSLPAQKSVYVSLFIVKSIEYLKLAASKGLPFCGNEIFDAMIENPKILTIEILQFIFDHGFSFENSRPGTNIILKILQLRKTTPTREVVKFFVDHGAEVDSIDGVTGKSALQLSIFQRNYIFACYLLDFGANPNYGNNAFNILDSLLASTSGLFLIYKLVINHFNLQNLVHLHKGAPRITPANYALFTNNRALFKLFTQYGSTISPCLQSVDECIILGKNMGISEEEIRCCY